MIGDLAVDYYLVLPPRGADEKRTASRTFRLPGGTGANAAAAAAALGSNVTLFSVVGADDAGTWLTAAMAGRAVSTRGVRVIEGSSTQATILLEPGQRQVIVDRGVADRLDEVDPAEIGDADIVYVTGSSAAISRVAGAGIRTRLVAGIEGGMADDLKLVRQLKNIDLLITNSTGWDRIESLATAVTAVETQGPAGAVIHAPSTPDVRIPGIGVSAVDETGAGDCLAGAVCHYLANGLDLAAAVRLAVAAAALSTRAIGAQGALPGDAAVRAAAGYAAGHIEVSGGTP